MNRLYRFVGMAFPRSHFYIYAYTNQSTVLEAGDYSFIVSKGPQGYLATCYIGKNVYDKSLLGKSLNSGFIDALRNFVGIMEEQINILFEESLKYGKD